MIKTLSPRLQRIILLLYAKDTAVRTSPSTDIALTSRLLAWSSQGTIVFASPFLDKLSALNPPSDIYGPATRLYATVPSIDVSSKRSHILESVAQPINPVDNV